MSQVSEIEVSAHAEQHAAAHAHIVPVRVLAGVLAALLVLTFLTVAATWVSLGSLNLWVAMLIASCKAALVVLYFMHLRYDRPFNAVVFLAALAFLTLFLALAMLDVFHYEPNIKSYREQDVSRYAPLIQADRPTSPSKP